MNFQEVLDDQGSITPPMVWYTNSYLLSHVTRLRGRSFSANFRLEFIFLMRIVNKERLKTEHSVVSWTACALYKLCNLYDLPSWWIFLDILSNCCVVYTSLNIQQFLCANHKISVPAIFKYHLSNTTNPSNAFKPYLNVSHFDHFCRFTRLLTFLPCCHKSYYVDL